MKKQNNIALILILLTVTIALILIIPGEKESLSEVTGMHKEQLGRAIIKFGNETPPPPPPPPSGGGGSSAGQAECCNYTRYQDMEYECRCFIYDHEVVRMQPTICCDDPTNPKCLPFCNPIQQPMPPPAEGICPIKQMCGEKCCKEKEYCRNGQCLPILPEPSKDIPPPPELEEPTLISIPYTEYAFPWWYFVLAILILLCLTYLLVRQPKRKETPQPTPAPTPAKRTVKHRKRRKKH